MVKGKLIFKKKHCLKISLTYIPVEVRAMVKVADKNPTMSGSNQSLKRFITINYKCFVLSAHHH